MVKKTVLSACLVMVTCLVLMAGCALPPGGNSSTNPSQNAAPSTQPAPSIRPAPSNPGTASNQNNASPQPAVTSNPTAIKAAMVNMPSFADLMATVEHGVVKIDTVGNAINIFGRTVQQQGAGSGWIINSDGSVVTNNHVVEGATSITITTLDGKTYPAQLVNADSVADLAVLKINAGQLTVLTVGDASKLRAGDWVLAIGNPLGAGIIATQGIVSRLGVTVPVSSTQTYNNLIETTAAINPGNSGGPLINMSGEVIGITSAKVSASGIEGMGYAINMVDALPVIQKLSATGK